MARTREVTEYRYINGEELTHGPVSCRQESPPPGGAQPTLAHEHRTPATRDISMAIAEISLDFLTNGDILHCLRLTTDHAAQLSSAQFGVLIEQVPSQKARAMAFSRLDPERQAPAEGWRPQPLSPVTPDPGVPIARLAPFAWVLNHGEPTIIHDFQGHASLNDALPEPHPRIRNLLIAPIRSMGVVIGAVAVANHPSRFTEGDLEAVQALANVAGLAMRAAHDQREKNDVLAQLTRSQRLESLGSLASGMAHEINNPLGMIMNYGELILDLPELGEPLKEYASSIVKETARLGGIVRNLLDFSRDCREAPSLAQLDTIVMNTLALMRPTLRREKILVNMEIPSDLPGLVCRPQQIQQVLMNLLINTRDALNERFPESSPDKSILITLRSMEREQATWLRLTVGEHGPGVPPEIAKRIFDPFFTTKTPDKGTGLGLSISARIIQEHQGALWFESVPGEGASFHVDLRAFPDRMCPPAAAIKREDPS